MMRVSLFLLASLAILSPSVAARQKILIYSRTAGFRHDSIETAVAAIEELGRGHSFKTVATEDQSKFNDYDWLDQFDALVFLSTSGQVLDKKGTGNMRKYIERGGGFIGVHEACETNMDTPWFGRLLGAFFNNHPFTQDATILVQKEFKDHPAVSHLSKAWRVHDEIYSFQTDPRDLGKNVVLTVDSSSFISNDAPASELAKLQGSPHPIAWYQEGNLLDASSRKLGGGLDDRRHGKASTRGTGGPGRAMYTGLGHTKASWQDEDMLNHILGTIQWVLDSPSIRSAGPTAPKNAPGSKYVDLNPAQKAGKASPTAPLTGVPGVVSTARPGVIPGNSGAVLGQPAAAASQRGLRDVASATLALTLGVAVGIGFIL